MQAREVLVQVGYGPWLVARQDGSYDAIVCGPALAREGCHLDAGASDDREVLAGLVQQGDGGPGGAEKGLGRLSNSLQGEVQIEGGVEGLKEGVEGPQPLGQRPLALGFGVLAAQLLQQQAAQHGHDQQEQHLCGQDVLSRRRTQPGRAKVAGAHIDQANGERYYDRPGQF